MNRGFSFIITAIAQFLAGLGGLALAALIGRIGGPDLLGSFAVLISLLGVLGMISRRGQGSLLTRSVAWAIYSHGYSEALTLLVLAVRRVVVLSLVLGVLGSILLLSGFFGNPFPVAPIVFPFLLLLVTILSLYAAYARGSGRPWLAPFFEIGGVALVTAGLLVLALPTWSDLQAPAVMVTLSIAVAILIGLASTFSIRDYRGGNVVHPTSEQRKELQVGQIPFTLIAISSYLIQSGSFLLAAPFLSEGDLGLLRAAERLALLVSFPVLAVIPIITPDVVRFARSGDVYGLTRVMACAMAVCGGSAALVLLGLLVWPERALALMGEEFKSAVPFLKIMSVAHLAAALLGPLVGLLHSSGRERQSMWINLATLALALVLVPWLSLGYGPTGFAAAYAAIIVTRIVLIGAVAVFSGLLQPLHTSI